MQAIEMTIPAPAQRRRFTRIAAIALTVTALVLAIAGTVALAANVLRNGDGYFNWPTETFTSGGYAIAMKTVDISDAPRWSANVMKWCASDKHPAQRHVTRATCAVRGRRW